MQKENATKSLAERALHATLFEGLALLIFSPIVSFVMNKSLIHTATLTIMMATTAMAWNMIYNSIFDRLVQIKPEHRKFGLRFIHAIVFEAGLILAVVPMVAWWFETSLYEAFILDIGLLLLFFPYTIAFNWAYDVIHAALVRKRLKRIKSCY